MAGRHRKPTHTRRNLAAVTASGAFLLPLSATAAEARTPEPARANPGSGILDAIAHCESSGNPRASNGTHFGLFQFDRSTWASVGGSGDPRSASVAEQYRRAAALLAARGTQPWLASKSCWAGKVGSAPRIARTETPRASSPAVKPRTTPKASTKGVTGKRAADGTGSYVCTPDKLYFEACDPHNLGTVQQYPPYNGRHRLAAKASTVTAPAATVASSGASAGRTAALLTAAARGYLGVPYRYGGTTRLGMDCSGLVWAALRDLGLNPPRTSAAQYAWTRRITAAEAKPGDLVFFYSPVSHVGIYLGGGKMLDSSQPGTRIAVRSVYPGAKFGRVPG